MTADWLNWLLVCPLQQLSDSLLYSVDAEGYATMCRTQNTRCGKQREKNGLKVRNAQLGRGFPNYKYTQFWFCILDWTGTQRLKPFPEEPLEATTKAALPEHSSCGALCSTLSPQIASHKLLHLEIWWDKQQKLFAPCIRYTVHEFESEDDTFVY